MSWFSFNSKEKEYSISLNTIAKEFGLSVSSIQLLLIDAGYNPRLLHFSKLQNKHLEVILLAYVHSIKSLYKEASNNYSKYTLKEQEELRTFFGKFIRKSILSPEIEIRINDRIFPAKNGKIYKSDLDNDLICDYFFKRIEHLEAEQGLERYHLETRIEAFLGIYRDIDEIYKSSLSGDVPRPSFIYQMLKWRTKVKQTFTDIKSRIFTTIITGHYYIFSAEEDSAIALLPSLHGASQR